MTSWMFRFDVDGCGSSNCAINYCVTVGFCLSMANATRQEYLHCIIGSARLGSVRFGSVLMCFDDRYVRYDTNSSA